MLFACQFRVQTANDNILQFNRLQFSLVVPDEADHVIHSLE